MVSGDQMLALTIDGSQPPDAATVELVNGVCGEAEVSDRTGPLVLRVSGRPAAGWTDGLNVGLVTKWERALRRLERLPRLTVGVATGDCGGAALDVFLTADVRVTAPGARLLVAHDGTATWPGMAVYRLAQLAGVAAVRPAVLFGRPIDAADAVRIGIADVVGKDEAAGLEAAGGLAGELSGKEAGIRRQLLFDAGTTSFEDALGAHLAACDRAVRTAPKASQ